VEAVYFATVPQESTALVFTVEDSAKRQNIYGKTTGVGNLRKAVETGNP
jgi:hypothetical protein